MKKTVFFVRHAESESNVAGLISGGGNDIPLTKFGRQQAKQAGRELKDKGVQLVVCSPLLRTVETATIIAEELGYDPQKILTNPLLIERAYGIYEGQPEHVYMKDFESETVHESVETTKQMHERIGKAFDWLRTLDADKIVVVSHGGASRAVRVIDQKLHHSHMYKLEKLPNASIYQFEL